MDRPTNILVVDDDLNVRQALGEALQSEDYSVASAANGSEALQRFAAPGLEKVDLVILDLNLGHESGWDVFRRLTTIAPHLPVIIITAIRDQKPPPSTRPCAAVLQKPLDFSALFQTLRGLTGRPELILQSR
jgi:DNA-binding response OmpR family regulator